MKILDNKKDYYDYISGIYGIDTEIVYDRRGSIVAKNRFEEYGIRPFSPTDRRSWYLRVIAGEKSWPFIIEPEEGGGYKVSVYNHEDIFQMNMDYYRKHPWMLPYNPFPDPIQSPHHQRDYFKNICEEIKPTREYPLILEYSMCSGRGDFWTMIKNPILSGLPIVSYIPAEEIWQAIYDYLIKLREPEIIDTRTDEEKAESHGFDRKTSFRKDKEDDKRRKI